jgi:hypothetical protein
MDEFSMVFALAGDSTIRRCLGIIKCYIQELIFESNLKSIVKKIIMSN